MGGTAHIRRTWATEGLDAGATILAADTQIFGRGRRDPLGTRRRPRCTHGRVEWSGKSAFPLERPLAWRAGVRATACRGDRSGATRTVNNGLFTRFLKRLCAWCPPDQPAAGRADRRCTSQYLLTARESPRRAHRGGGYEQHRRLTPGRVPSGRGCATAVTGRVRVQR